MGKKIEKGLKNEKNQSATSQDDTDSNKALVNTGDEQATNQVLDTETNPETEHLNVTSNEPHVCTGNFQADFTELCRRNNMIHIPPIIMRPRPPGPQSQQETSPAKGGKDKGKQAQPEPEPEETAEDGEPEPKTYTTKDKFEYFKPSVQVEQDHPDKPETVTEVFIRGWKIDLPMMEVFKQCWPTMEKLHTINLWNTGLNNETLQMLASFLPNCTNLRNLTLDGNVSSEENWYELISEESPVQNLSLRHCGITDKGAIVLGRCLGSMKKSNVKLLSLNLSNNKIGDAGVMELAQGLRMNRTLLSLSLASNQIGNKGVSKLAEVLSRFPLTHEEVVERRKQMSDRSSPDRNKSPTLDALLMKGMGRKRSIMPPLSRRAESKDRPGSVRSNTHAGGGKKVEKPSAKAKKDGKGKDEKDDKHDKTKGGKKEKEEKPAAKKDHLKVPSHGRAQSPGRHDHGHHRAFAPKTTEPHLCGASTVGGRSSGASIAADTAKGGKDGKKNKGKDGGRKPTPGDNEAPDSPDFINPLTEGADFMDGQLWVAGNRVLINLNLSRNKIGEVGLEALLKAVQYQTTLSMDNKISMHGTGLMRLLVTKNVPSNCEVIQKLTDIMLPKDPFYKPPPQTPDVNES